MDTGGLLGPTYSYADELATPSELNIRRDGSFEGINRAVGGVSYYVDAIGFGESSSMSKTMGMPNQQPLGIQYFTKTGMACSNGADMFEYVSTVPGGLGGRVGNEVQTALGVKLRGLGPGILEDAVSALNPLPIFRSVMGSGYPKCKKMTLPVGDLRGRIRSDYNPNNLWVSDPFKTINGRPSQTRWVFDQYISQEDYDATPKTEKPNVLPQTEGFAVGGAPTVAAGVLFAALFLGVVAYSQTK